MSSQDIDETRRLETLIGISDALLTQMGELRCADCGTTDTRNAMWYVLWGTHAICRSCRDWRVNQQEMRPMHCRTKHQ